MKIIKLIKEIRGIFKLPKINYYFGKLKYGTPYFYPTYFNEHIISIRRLKLRSKEDYQYKIKNKPWLKEKEKFSNLPMIRRSKDWIIRIFKNWYWIQIGYPFKIHKSELGWKDKYETPRFEWSPSFQIFFFNWQFCIFWNAPDGDNDKYYEMILWYLKYSNKDIIKAEKTWAWRDYNTKKSTWDKNYLI